MDPPSSNAHLLVPLASTTLRIMDALTALGAPSISAGAGAPLPLSSSRTFPLDPQASQIFRCYPNSSAPSLPSPSTFPLPSSSSPLSLPPPPTPAAAPAAPAAAAAAAAQTPEIASALGQAQKLKESLRALDFALNDAAWVRGAQLSELTRQLLGPTLEEARARLEKVLREANALRLHMGNSLGKLASPDESSSSSSSVGAIEAALRDVTADIEARTQG